ncbi:MAG TPA: MFS transporter [Caulobacteraceae bacterium]|jgi:MFS family permease|nr:MFS transporter [Caulobacteraceae bacterium]
MAATVEAHRQTRTMLIVVLLAVAVFINYVDRGNLATAAPLMKDELKLSNTQMGLLLSAFFWTYTPGQILAGWLSERINAYRVLALGLALWAAATALTGLASAFSVLIALRLLLGLGESAAFPCSSKLLAEFLPQERLGWANGLIGAGLALGPAFGTLAGGLFMAQVGWRASFILFGLVSVTWLVPWFFATRHASRLADAHVAEPAPSFLAILSKRAAWGASLGHFSANYSFYFVVSWLPLYLVKARGFTVTEMAELGGLIYLIYAASNLATGWLCDLWMRAGGSANRVRKSFIVTGHAGVGACMAACAIGGPMMQIASLLLAAVFFGFNTPNIFAIAQTLAGPRAAGKWVGVQNCIGNTAGIIAPIVTGMVVDRTGQFVWAFAIAGVFGVTGMIAWGLVIPKIALIDWRGRAPAAAVPEPA